MGRRKISIQPITDERNRKVTFVKRKAGLFKKAHELAVLCQVDLAVIILGNNNNRFYEYISVDTDELLVSYKDSRFTHDTKTPADYGDYLLESRVKSTAANSHQRNASSVSISVEENDNDHSSDDDDDDDDDEDEEEPPKPTPKRRKTQSRGSRVKEEVQEPKPHLQAAVQVSAMGPTQAPYSQQVQQVQQVQHQTQPPQLPQLTQTQPWGQPPQHASVDTPPQPQGTHAAYGPFAVHDVPQPYQFPVPGNFTSQPLLHRPRSDIIAEQQQQQQQQQHQQQQLEQQQQEQHQHLLSQPQSHLQHQSQQLPPIGTPLVQNSQLPHSSPFMNSRARSLNNSISTRPILRVEIPSDPTRPAQGTKAGDSALTMTAMETSKENNSTENSSTLKPSGNKTPPSAKSGDDVKPSGLGILSNNSTPVSATLPSALFNLPPPQAMPHFHPNNNGNFKPLLTGEQTPLTGGLPSRYVPDLFPSPSNFYSNDWNIPFGSGNTPYPSSAGPHMLPIPGGSALSANTKIRKHTILNQDPVDSPLQSLQKGVGSSKDGKKAVSELEAKKINFGQMSKGEGSGDRPI